MMIRRFALAIPHAELVRKWKLLALQLRVGESQRPQSRISPFLVIGVLAILLALAIWYRVLRARNRRSRS